MKGVLLLVAFLNLTGSTVASPDLQFHDELQNIRDLLHTQGMKLKEYEEKLDTMTKRMTNFEVENAELRNRIVILEALNTSVDSGEEPTGVENDDNKKHTYDVIMSSAETTENKERPTSNRIKRVGLTTSGIGFYATLSADKVSLNTPQTIIFDRVVTNTGNAYDPQFGFFSASKTGLYLFSATIHEDSSNSANHLIIEFYMNGTQVGIMESTSHNAEASKVIVLYLNVGDKVWIHHNGGVGEVIDGSNWSSFSGVLIAGTQ